MATDKFGRIMIFVDGTNLLVRANEEIGGDIRAEKPSYLALHMANVLVNTGIADMTRPDSREKGIVIRRYWFGSYQGNEQDKENLRKILRDETFEPVLFRKRKGREKGVDIALTMAMLVNAFNQNFDTGILIAGDEDYVDLVQEVKRYGPMVHGAFLQSGLSKNLKLTFDDFHFLRLNDGKVAGVVTQLKSLSHRAL